MPNLRDALGESVVFALKVPVLERRRFAVFLSRQTRRRIIKDEGVHGRNNRIIARRFVCLARYLSARVAGYTRQPLNTKRPRKSRTVVLILHDTHVANDTYYLLTRVGAFTRYRTARRYY